MGRVAIEAADVAAGVGGFGKMGLLVAFAVASQTTGAGFLPGMIFEDEYLGFVAATFHVLGSGAVAGFAALLRGAGILIKGGLPVGRFLPAVLNLFMACLAGFGANVLRRIGRRTGGGMHCGRWRTLAALRSGLANSEDEEEERN
jgi:hypothetical protein